MLCLSLIGGCAGSKASMSANGEAAQNKPATIKVAATWEITR